MTVNTSKCATCSHPNRQQIDLALVAGIACRSVARQSGLSPDSVQRHRNSHLPAALLRGREAEEIARARVLVEQVGALHKRTITTLTEAERTGQLRTVMLAVREARRNLELLVRVQVRRRARFRTWLPLRNGSRSAPAS